MTQASHAYLVVSGSYNSVPEEHWQYGIRFYINDDGASSPANSGTLPLNDVGLTDVHRTETDWTIASNWSLTSGANTFNPDDWLNDQVAPALAAHFGAHVWGDVKVDTLKASPIGTDGHVVGGQTALLTWTGTKPSGDGSTNPLPLENSLVVSWATPRIGPKGRGRIYYPVMSSNVTGSDGRASSTVVSATLAEVVAQIEAMTTSSDITGGWNVRPIVTGSPWTQYGIVTSVRVGNIIDTQRRRRRQTAEVYTAADTSY